MYALSALEAILLAVVENRQQSYRHYLVYGRNLPRQQFL